MFPLSNTSTWHLISAAVLFSEAAFADVTGPCTAGLHKQSQGSKVVRKTQSWISWNQDRVCQRDLTLTAAALFPSLHCQCLLFPLPIFNPERLRKTRGRERKGVQRGRNVKTFSSSTQDDLSPSHQASAPKIRESPCGGILEGSGAAPRVSAFQDRL